MLLVTTALEQTWGKNERILFLGEWCKLYDRKNIWSKREFETVSYHWDDRLKLKSDYLYLQKLNEELLIEITIALNKIHNVNHSSLYWRIVLGYWLNLFTAILFDRWEMIKSTMNAEHVLETISLDLHDSQIVANDSSDFNIKITSDFWNHAIYTKIIQYCSNMIIHQLDSSQIRTKNNILNIKPTSNIKKIVKSSISWFSQVTCRKDEPFIKHSYLPFQKEALLSLYYGVLPKFWSCSEIKNYQYDKSFRSWSLSSCAENFCFGSFVREMIPKLLPKIYLEGYKDILALINKLPWPKKPKFIFTANSHYFDDVFKMWSADKRRLNIPFVTVDHGGFGLNLFNGAIKYQYDISDLSLSWGFEDKKKSKIKPVGIVKTAGKKVKWDSKGFGLMVEVAMPRYSFDLRSMVISGQMLNYFEDQFCFYDNLPDHMQRQVLIRLYQQDNGWQQKKRWQDRFYNVSIDYAKKSMYSQFTKARIIIATYNATTYLESLSLNIPTIIFWDPNYWEIRDDAKPYFNLLRDVGIYHSSPQGAAFKMVEIWDHMSDWWYSRDIQQAREYFCRRYAHEELNLVKVIKKNIDKMIS